MRYWFLLVLFITFLGLENLYGIALPSPSTRTINWGLSPKGGSSTQPKEKKSKIERKQKIKNFFKLKKVKKALKKPSPEFKLLDILLIALIVILLLIVLTLLDGLTRGLLGALLTIILIVVLVLWLMGKI